MEFFHVVASRYSYRGAYKDQPVPREDLQRIVQAGLQAPSAMNAQTTSFVIVDDPAKLERLAEILPNIASLKTAKAVLVVCVDKHDPASERPDFTAQNYAAAVENAFLAATALGYATCWLEGWRRGEGAIQAVAKLVNLPETMEPRVLMPIGVPEQPGQPRAKRPFNERAWWNEYSG